MPDGGARRCAATVTGVVLVAAMAASCATEVDPEIVAPDTRAVPVTTEFVAAGSPSELLDQLLATAGGLSEAIVDNEGQHDLMTRIDTLWAAARPGVEASAPDRVGELERAIALMHTGVDRRRPADADKAYTNLVNLLAALPAPTV